MTTRIVIYADKNKPGGEEIMSSLVNELKALEIGTVETITEESLPTTLSGIDLETIALIVSIARLGVDAAKLITAVIETTRENRRRYADRKKVDSNSVSKNSLLLMEEDTIKASLDIPSEKPADEKKFINLFTELREKDEAAGNSNN